jgi:integrase
MHDEPIVPEVGIVPVPVPVPVPEPAEDLGEDDESPEDFQYWRPVQFRKVTLASLRQQIMALYEPPLKARATERMMRHAFDVLAEQGLETPFGLTEQFVAQLVKTRPAGNSPATVIGLLRCVRLIANYCVRRGYLRSSPFVFRPVGQWVRNVPVRKRRWHSRDEVRKVLDVMRRDVDDSTGWRQWKARRLYAVTATIAYCGLRAGEGFHLLVEDIDFERGMIDVVSRAEHRTKTVQSAQIVPMPPPLVGVLQDWLVHRMAAPEHFLSEKAKECQWVFPGVRRLNVWQDGPKGSTPRDRLKAAGQRSGVEGLTFLSLRHSWATLAEHLGMTNEGIKRVLRHTTPMTSEKYYRHREATYLKEMVRDFDF